MSKEIKHVSLPSLTSREPFILCLEDQDGYEEAFYAHDTKWLSASKLGDEIKKRWNSHYKNEALAELAEELDALLKLADFFIGCIAGNQVAQDGMQELKDNIVIARNKFSAIAKAEASNV